MKMIEGLLLAQGIEAAEGLHQIGLRGRQGEG